MIATTIRSSIKEKPRPNFALLQFVFSLGVIGMASFLLSSEQGRKREEARCLLPTSCIDLYCKIVVSVQFGDVDAAVPPALNRITPDGSPQKARCPVVPAVIGVATTT